MRKYSISFGFAAMLFGIGLAGFNWLVDPYWIFSGKEIRHFNSLKPGIGSKQRIFEIGRVRNVAPEILILGTSREDDSIDPNHPAFLGKRAFNAAISSQPYRETRLILDMLIKEQHAPKIVVAGLLFEIANTQTKLPGDFSDENFQANQRWKLLFNTYTVMDSLRTVRANLFGGHIPQEEANWQKNGYLYPSDYKINKNGHRISFTENEKHYLRDNHWPEPTCGYELFDSKTGHSNIEEMRFFVASIYQANIEAHLFIGPSHARQWETIAASGLWTQFEDWKRQLVRINEEEAKKAGKSPISLWDFSGYSSVTSEAVPSKGDSIARMLHYFESSHYTPAAGNLVLDRMFDYHAPNRKVPDDFGVRITSVNFETHLAQIRADRERYRRTHPDDIAEIEALAKKVAAEKHCVPSPR